MAVVTDTIADMLTRIRNANAMRYTEVKVPASNLKVSLAKIYEIMAVYPPAVRREQCLKRKERREHTLPGKTDRISSVDYGNIGHLLRLQL